MGRLKEHYNDEIAYNSDAEFIDDSDAPTHVWVDNSKRTSEIAACCKAINKDVADLDIGGKTSKDTIEKHDKIREVIYKHCAIFNCRPKAIKDIIFTSVGKYVDLKV